MGAFSVSHWLVVLLVVLLVFGPRRLSTVGRELGEGLRALKRGLSGEGGEEAQACEHDESKRRETPAGD